MGSGNVINQKRKIHFINLSNPGQEITIIKDLSEKIQLKVSINQIKKECSYKIKIFYIIVKEK